MVCEDKAQDMKIEKKVILIHPDDDGIQSWFRDICYSRASFRWKSWKANTYFFPFLFHEKDQSLKTPTPPPPQFSKQVVQLRPRT